LPVMELGGPEDILGDLVDGHPQERPCVLDRALHPVVPRRCGDTLMKRGIGRAEPPGLAARGHRLERPPQLGQVLVRAAYRRPPGSAALDGQPEVDGLLDLRQLRPDALRQPILGLGAIQHDDAAAGATPGFYVSLALKDTDGLADAGPGYAELLGQLPLGRELVTGNERAVMNGAPQFVHDQAVDRNVRNSLDGGLGWA